ncbi:MAG: STAS domain-containing protein [Acidimicrobiia bacterium]
MSRRYPGAAGGMSVHSERSASRSSLMKVDIDVKGSQAQISVAGEVDAHTSTALERAIDQALEAGARTLVVDVAEMSFIDSSGLRVLVQGRRRATEAGGALALRQPSDTVVRLLELTGLRELLEAS